MTQDLRMISASLEAPAGNPEQSRYSAEIQRTLEETQNALIGFAGVDGKTVDAKTWQVARKIVEEFRPVPWFIWRVSNFVFGTPGEIRNVPAGLVFGLRRLLFAAASDPVLGGAVKVTEIDQALKALNPDAIAAVSVVHALCRKLASKHLDRIWRPILDDALIRAQIGLRVGANDERFGMGRGMLAGFAGRVGLAILIASGQEEQAQLALEELAGGAETKAVGIKHYGCDPLQVAAMTLSAAGCGRDCAFGMVSYAVNKPGCFLPNEDQARWLAAFSITEHVRTGKLQDIGEDTWEFLNFRGQEARASVIEDAKKFVRRGHGWQWIL